MRRRRQVIATLLPVVFVVGCGAHTPDAGMAEPPPEPPPPPPTESIKILAYNVWMLPPVSRDNDARAAHIANHLIGYDVVVLSEAFDDGPRAQIVRALTERGYQATRVLGADLEPECRTQLGPVEISVNQGINGGVLIAGRHRLEHAVERPFGTTCVGEDCCAAKGVLYARFRTEEGRCLHVFGTHLQNRSPAVELGGEPEAMRRRQLEITRAFIDEAVDQSACPGPVFVAGDLNLRRQELPEAARILRARIPEHFAGPHSWGEHNRYAQSDEPERLDYVLVTDDYELPLYSGNETRIFRAPHRFTEGGGLSTTPCSPTCLTIIRSSVISNGCAQPVATVCGGACRGQRPGRHARGSPPGRRPGPCSARIHARRSRGTKSHPRIVPTASGSGATYRSSVPCASTTSR
jgi:endonuclease/exonuclease/phosphatase family metal-dependent hydrolase